MFLLQRRSLWSVLYIGCVTFTYVLSFNQNQRPTRHSTDRHTYSLFMLNSDEGSGSFRVITPDNIASLFSNAGAPAPSPSPTSSTLTVTKPSPTVQNSPSSNSAGTSSKQSYQARSNNNNMMTKESFWELRKLETEYWKRRGVVTKPPKRIEIAELDEMSENFIQKDPELILEDSYLSGELSLEEYRTVKSAFLMSPSIASAAPRTFSHHPQAALNITGDVRMQFGVYRRFSLKDKRSKADAESRDKDKKGVMEKARGGVDSFYNTIRNMGKGDRGSNVALEEPPRERTSSSSATKRSSKRKVVTPDDISSLFAPSSAKDDDYSGDGKDTPQWLVEAQERMDQDSRRSGRSTAKKQQTGVWSDWRVWAALIGGAGFATAFINVYQQTGGLGMTGPGPELII